MNVRLCSFAVVTITFATATIAQFPPSWSLKKSADFGMAMNGDGTSAWGNADEYASQRAQAISASLNGYADNRGREGNLAVQKACAVAGSRPATEQRAKNQTDYASMVQMKMRGTSGGLDQASIQKIRMVAVNRMDAYAQGWEAGASGTFDLIFGLYPEVRTRLCGDLRRSRK